VGGAASLLSRRRAAALGLAPGRSSSYGASRAPARSPVGRRRRLPRVVVFPAFAAAIWLALPLARLRSLRSSSSPSAGVRSLSSRPARRRLGRERREARVLRARGLRLPDALRGALVARARRVLVPWVDIWSVAAGPTEYVVEERPGIFERSPSRSRPRRDGDREPRPARRHLLLALPRGGATLRAARPATWSG
jgi:hypothetical protein